MASPPRLGASPLANQFRRKSDHKFTLNLFRRQFRCISHVATFYKPVLMSELGYWLRHLASGLRPSRISAVYEMYVKYLSSLFDMYVRGISDVDEM